MGFRRFALFLILGSLGYSGSSWSGGIHRSDLRPGDVILMPLRCWVCSLIEEETQSPFSHSGVVVGTSSEKLGVLEALQGVARVSLDEFMARREPGQPVRVMRPKSFQRLSAGAVNRALMATYETQFAGAPFDPDFGWSNRTPGGRELYYCSEFVAKLLGFHLRTPILPKPMTFQRHRQAWIDYFRRQPPDGELGLSPSDFERSPELVWLGDLH